MIMRSHCADLEPRKYACDPTTYLTSSVGISIVHTTVHLGGKRCTWSIVLITEMLRFGIT